MNVNNIAIDNNEQPKADSLVSLAIIGEDTTHAAVRYQINPRQAVAIDMLMDLSKPCTLMPSIVTENKLIAQAYTLFTDNSGNPNKQSNDKTQLDAKAIIIKESTGFIAQRIGAMIINLSCDIALQSIASSKDIDRAVKLGLGYPYRPISWGDKLGAQRILLILPRIYSLTGDLTRKSYVRCLYLRWFEKSV